MAINVTVFMPFIVLFILFSMPDSIMSQWIPPQYHLQGEWQLLQGSIGISAMHMQLIHNNKVVIFDRTDFGPSNLSLPGGRCRFDSTDIVLKMDCTAHSVLYDIGTNTYRPLMLLTDTRYGTLVQTGGYNDGDHVVRTLKPCTDDLCDWCEVPRYLMERRWYATDQILPDGRIVLVGGRMQFNYEFYPKNLEGSSPSTSFTLDFLRQTRDPEENNLYPFVHLLPDGNLFIFANTRSILLDYKRNVIVREFPSITIDDPRNYPSSGSSVMLPINENYPIVVEIMVCGGAPRGAFSQAISTNFVRASSSCGRLRVSAENPGWIIRIGHRWLGKCEEPSPSSRPRLYHSSALLLTDGRILVGGSNPQPYYNFTGVMYPTDLSLEAFTPPYLSAEYSPIQPTIEGIDEVITYGQSFRVGFTVPQFLKPCNISVTIVAPSFTTHSLAMNQRLIMLKVVESEPTNQFE
ncbi:Glyoxal oxidase, N-terminal, partial [Dillenia turbinata]